MLSIKGGLGRKDNTLLFSAEFPLAKKQSLESFLAKKKQWAMVRERAC